MSQTLLWYVEPKGMVPEARNTYIACRAVNDHLHGSIRDDGVVGVWTGIPERMPGRRRSSSTLGQISPCIGIGIVCDLVQPKSLIDCAFRNADWVHHSIEPKAEDVSHASRQKS